MRLGGDLAKWLPVRWLHCCIVQRPEHDCHGNSSPVQPFPIVTNLIGDQFDWRRQEPFGYDTGNVVETDGRLECWRCGWDRVALHTLPHRRAPSDQDAWWILAILVCRNGGECSSPDPSYVRELEPRPVVADDNTQPIQLLRARWDPAVFHSLGQSGEPHWHRGDHQGC